MKIVIVIPTLTVGGAEKIALDTAIGMYEKHNDITIIVLSDLIELNVPNFIRVVCLKNNKLLQLINLLKQEKFDGCISYMERANLFAAIACKITNTKFCASVHTAPKVGFAQRKFINKIGIRVTYKIIKFLNSKVICVCDGIKRELSYLYGLENTVVIPNFINQNDLDYKSNDKTSGLNKSDFIFIGRLSQVKGCDVLIDAIINVKDILVKKEVRINIIGDGPEKDVLEKKIINADLDENVQFLGKLQNPYPFLRNSKHLIVPSYAEGFGLVILEGLSLGCNVIYSQCDFGPSEIMLNSFPEISDFHISDPSKNRNASVSDLSIILTRLASGEYERAIPDGEIKKRIDCKYNRIKVCDDIIKNFI